MFKMEYTNIAMTHTHATKIKKQTTLKNSSLLHWIIDIDKMLCQAKFSLQMSA